MELCIAILLFLLTFLLTFLRKKEGFNPFFPDTKLDIYPDQSKSGDLILSEKYIQKMIDSPTLDKRKKRYLYDLLNLLQFI